MKITYNFKSYDDLWFDLVKVCMTGIKITVSSVNGIMINT